jgi:hypothetical protein
MIGTTKIALNSTSLNSGTYEAIITADTFVSTSVTFTVSPKSFFNISIVSNDLKDGYYDDSRQLVLDINQYGRQTYGEPSINIKKDDVLFNDYFDIQIGSVSSDGKAQATITLVEHESPLTPISLFGNYDLLVTIDNVTESTIFTVSNFQEVSLNATIVENNLQVDEIDSKAVINIQGKGITLDQQPNVRGFGEP